MRIIREQGLKWLCVGFFLGIAFVGACSSGGTAIAQAIIEALDVVYDNSASGLQATNVQAAIDEVHGNQTALGGTVTVLDAEVGDLANLTTTTQASLVAAWAEMARPAVVPPAGLPTLVVPAGRADYVSDDWLAACRAALGADLTVAPVDAGHMVYLERPAEVAALLREFLG